MAARAALGVGAPPPVQGEAPEPPILAKTDCGPVAVAAALALMGLPLVAPVQVVAAVVMYGAILPQQRYRFQCQLP